MFKTNVNCEFLSLNFFFFFSHRSVYDYEDPVGETLMLNLLCKYQSTCVDVEEAEEFLFFASDEMFKYNTSDIIQTKTIDRKENDLRHDMKIGRITCSSIFQAIARHTPKENLIDIILGNVEIPISYSKQRGIDLQKKVIDAVSFELNVPLSRCGLILDPIYPWLIASPDAVGPNFVVEIKNCLSMKKFKNYYLVPNSDHLKEEFYCQMQLQMYLKKVPFGYFVIAAPDFQTSKNVKIIKIKYDNNFAQKMVEVAREFWKKNIFAKILDQAIR